MPPARKYPPRVIDAHAHVFNARYVPISSLAKGYIGDKGYGLHWLLGRLETIVYAVTAAPDITKEPALSGMPEVADVLDDEEAIEQFAVEVEKVVAQETWATAFSPVSRGTGPSIKALTATVAANPLFAALAEVELVFEASGELAHEPTPALPSEEVIQHVTAKASVERLALEHSSFTLSAVNGLKMAAPRLDMARDAADVLIQSTALVPHTFYRSLTWLLRKIARLLVDAGDRAWEGVQGVGTMVWRMLKGEPEVCRRLFGGYRKYQNVTAAIHLMMDMEHGYERPDRPYYPYPSTQLDRMYKLNQWAGDALVGFAAFDPRRDDFEALFTKARELGFKGFKFYPGLGYKPWENDDNPVVQARIEWFYGQCIKHDLPVFAHCTPTGFRSKIGSGLNSDPRLWRKALSGNNHAFRELRLCLGHGGGLRQEHKGFVSAGWDAPDEAAWESDDNYAREAVSLCQEFPNVYLDFGHMQGLIGNGPAADRFRVNLVREWNVKLDENGTSLSKRAMYGSDSHMPGLVAETADYLDHFYDLFVVHEKEKLGNDAFADFAYGNARSFLRLS